MLHPFHVDPVAPFAAFATPSVACCTGAAAARGVRCGGGARAGDRPAAHRVTGDAVAQPGHACLPGRSCRAYGKSRTGHARASGTARTRLRTRTCAHRHTRARTHTRAHSHKHAHAPAHTHAHRRTHERAHTDTHARTHTHTCALTPTHARTHAAVRAAPIGARDQSVARKPERRHALADSEQARQGPAVGARSHGEARHHDRTCPRGLSQRSETRCNV
jgi:hypothetical protein